MLTTRRERGRPDAGGERVAASHSLLGTARLYGLDPEYYLRYVFERIADHPVNGIDELLPWHVVRLSADRTQRDAA